ncbi:D-glycero-beta-D-manno-heptose 1-phosphate adenylyltransferase [Chitinimonas sp. BJB300]|uniref:D-glycero-beta-D-manno-heptose 1-phosphate adenylyltransferase n=1 Tax=Chitinimonas sp. BJB300 TaxID=1559339 RepID=UPI000C0E26FF|nr:D-glycero-beta-D-manno-heptose 1-phosphate adenylyltransferase [Chitinimonas sp. BJB300]PHV09717.1 D-glycero-beta-D-manno-heptose 1-phosphate adenylyltransferase [Chitinimonas sp. BJB300]TSJ91416.1 D-glycero-beta-D-manno-heptose 1-phosphate adenylyltransferase [Chitinimonas sp. BJB300]
MTRYDLPLFEGKLCAPEALVERLASLKRPLVFTNGCFDILHRGHVTYLAQARALGAAMVVAINTDISVKRLGKGNDRPINPTENRAAVLASLAAVDLVTWFDSDTPYDLIMAIKPNILVKGGDWTPENIVGSKEVLEWGGEVHSIPFCFDTSTTATLRKIRSIG